MRTVWVRWATCALAIATVVPAFADRPRRSLAACTRFDQADQGESRVAFTIHNGCSIPVDCAVSWRVVGAPDTRKRRAARGPQRTPDDRLPRDPRNRDVPGRAAAAGGARAGNEQRGERERHEYE